MSRKRFEIRWLDLLSQDAPENYLKICKCLIQQLRIAIVLILAQSVRSPAVSDCRGEGPEVLTQPRCLSTINRQDMQLGGVEVRVAALILVLQIRFVFVHLLKTKN